MHPYTQEQLKPLSEILSPIKIGENDSDRYPRISGRFGYQMLSDVISFSQNLPQRILLLEKLNDLPTLIHQLLQDDEMQQIIQRELKIDTCIANEIINLNNNELQEKIEKSAETLLKIAEQAWNPEKTSTPLSPPVFPQATQERTWWKLLLLALPHIERQVWLTEMSAPLPIHAITRFHDIWSAFILLWCYSKRDIFFNTENSTPKEQFKPAFGTDECIYLSIVSGWKTPVWNTTEAEQTLSRQTPTDSYQTRIVVGPYFLSSLDKNKNKYSDFFRTYIEIATHNIPGWSDRNTATPQREELEELVMSKLSISTSELNQRLKCIRNSWEQARALRIDPSAMISRDDWEYLASVAVWLSRWKIALNSTLAKEIALQLKVNSLAISFPGWELKMVNTPFPLNENYEGASFNPVSAKLTFSNSSICIDKTLIFLETIKAACEDYGLDMPNVMLNRMRERQAANWSLQLMGINNLMNRHTHGASSIDGLATNGHERSGNLLRGAGGRLCQHLLSITHAHNANIYWMDYSRFPAKLEPIEGYSRLLKHRAHRAQIVAAFDKKSYDINDPSSSCHLRQQAASQIYRVAARNEAEVLSKDGTAIWDGYCDPLIPKSAMALPMRQNGKVVGIIELNGLVKDQFSRRLLSPLLTAANLIGPFLYQNLHLRQLAKINRWVTETDPLRLEEADNPLEDVARHLTNIFLCPMVHIWLCRQDTEIYELWGYNLTKPFDNYMKKSGRPWFRVTDSDQSAYSADTPFSRLSIDLWRHVAGNDYPWGHFCKGRFFNEDKTTHLELESARTAGVRLYRDFVNTEDTDRSYRKIIFGDLSFRDVAAFHLVRIDSPEIQENCYGTTMQATETVPLGVVLLHDFGDSSAQETGEMISQFGAGWEPTVDYLQQYLPTLLEQVSMFHSSVQQARRLLLHQARHELAEVERRLPKLLGQLHYVFEGEGREALRRVVQAGGQSSGSHIFIPSSAWEEIHKLQDAIIATDNSRLYLDTENFAARIGRLAGKLKSVRSYTTLKLDPGEACTSVDLLGYIREELTNRKSENRIAGRAPKPTGFRREKYYSVWVVKTAWDRLMINLFSNMSKYSVDNRDWKIDIDGLILTLENIGLTHPDDKSEELLRPGRRGRAVMSKEGEGLGLTDADLAAKLLGIKMEYSIRRLSSAEGNFAYHTYRLNLTNVLTISHKG